jgi:UDP-2,3-diacylglucosamine pyrophosphatase LpxH
MILELIKGTVIGKPKELKVVLLNDLHFGSEAVDYNLLDRIFKFIDENRDHVRILINGDIIEGATKQSKGDIYKQRMSPEEQIDFAVKKFKPYADLIDGVVQGNHDARIENETSIDPIRMFCRYLDIEDKYLKYEGIVIYSWNKCFYSIQMHHGSGSGSTETGIINRMKKMKKSNAHVLYCGHWHKQVAKPYIQHAIDPYNLKIRTEKHWLVCGNTITKHAEYAKKFAYEEYFPSQAYLKMSGIQKKKGIDVQWLY